MLELGKCNTLKVSSQRDLHYYVDGGALGEIPLSNAPPDLQTGDEVTAFVYIDGKNQTQATLQTPKAQVNEVAWLKVVSTSHAGAFLDWGLPKDLLLPFSEQKGKVSEGRHCLVRLFLDEDNRIAASMRLDDFIQDQAFYYQAGQQVKLTIAEATELGFKAVVDDHYWGVLYRNEVFQPLKKGQTLTGYIKNVRADHKLDLTLNSAGKYGDKVHATAEKILAALQQAGGFLALTDRSSPETVYARFAVSKKIFKQAIGNLYKQHKIEIQADGIRLPRG